MLNDRLKINLIYLLPQDGNGGAETIFNSFNYRGHVDNVNFTKIVLDINKISPFGILKGFWNLFSAIKLNQRNIVISSLWKAHMICLFLRLFYKSVELIPFIHSAYFFHRWDQFISTLILKKSKWALFDSDASRQARLRYLNHSNHYVLNMLTHKTDRCRYYSELDKDLKIVYVGRITEEKGVTANIEFCKKLLEIPCVSKVSFHVFGEGEESYIRRCINSVEDIIDLELKFNGVLERHSLYRVLSNYDIYLQLSSKEGLAMSVVEAMSLGLLCVVSPVGEISNYCKHMVNGFLCESDNTVTEINQFLNNSRVISARAHLTFRDSGTFSEDLNKWIANTIINV
uniref:glycosyltransferase n=1 Tax=Algoriphagus sp. TaxID=1872435 RepID=UPI0040474608